MNIAHNLAACRARIDIACKKYARNPTAVDLLAVSKFQPTERLQAVYAAGLRNFGENYLQSALGAMKTIPNDAVWHFIGHIQSNKTRDIARHFSWVQSVDRIKIATRLQAQRPAQLPPLQICIQVNLDAEATKSGCAPQTILSLAKAILQLPNLQLRGLMAIPRAAPDDDTQRRCFARLRELFMTVKEHLDPPYWDTLSMGMSADFEAAIAEGSTLLRLGTALFGERVRQAGSAPHVF